MLGFGSTSWNELVYLSLLHNSKLLGYPASQRQDCEILEDLILFISLAPLNGSSFLISLRWQSAYFSSKWFPSSAIPLPGRTRQCQNPPFRETCLLGMHLKGNAGQFLCLRTEETIELWFWMCCDFFLFHLLI